MCFKTLAHILRTYKAIKIIAFVIAVLVGTHAAVAAPVSQLGVVTRVVDGDTLWLKTGTGTKPFSVRVGGIDAPEICQQGGVQARDALARRVLGQNVVVTSNARDDFGRTVGKIHLNGEDMSRWMVANGHAWVYSYQGRKAAYSDELAQAKAGRKGLFAEASPLEPRLFRKQNANCWIAK